MLFSILSSGDIRMTLISILLSLPVIVLALSTHEAAHGFVAWKCGDPTAYNLGRITLNPLKHLDPVGAVCMLVFGFGWARPVPINTRNFKHPKRGMALTAAAGPFANLILGVLNTLFYTFFWNLFQTVSVNDEFSVYVFIAVLNLFYVGALLNFTLMFFNLIPVPPFDGSRIVTVFLPTDLYFRIMKYERQIMIGLLAILFLLSYVFDISLTSWLSEWLFEQFEKPFDALMQLIF